MAYLLIQADDSNSAIPKGEIIWAKDEAIYGKQERLPANIRLEITGITADEVEAYSRKWRTALDYEVVTQDSSKWQVKVTVQSKIVNRTGIGKTVKQGVKDWILSTEEHTDWVATQVSVNDDQITLDIAKNQIADNLAEIRKQVNDYFEAEIAENTGFRKYRFRNADVDFAERRGSSLESDNEDGNGYIPSDLIHHSIDRSTAISRIIDRTAD